jgi:type IX secretion system PorP/SprF family membrane protein
MYISLYKKRSILIAVCISFWITGFAQQNPTTDNYLFNPVSISPAYAGQQNGQIQTLYDAQWIGLKGAPRTGSMYFDYMSPKGLAINLGIIDDQVGPLQTQNIGLSTAYHLQLSKDLYISAGIRYTMNKTAVDILDEFYWDKVDQSIFNIDGPFFQNVDLGGSIYTKTWYLGSTFKNIVVQEMYTSNYTARVGHIFGGYKFIIDDNYVLSPSFLVNITENAPTDLNLHAFMEYKSELGLGFNYSPKDEIGTFLKMRLSDNYSFFYQFNYPL